MSIVVELSMFPIGKEESVSIYVSRIIKMIDASGIQYKLNPMGTVFETETMSESLGIIEKAYRQLEDDCSRVYCTVKFDIRKGDKSMLSRKIKSLEERLGKKIST